MPDFPQIRLIKDGRKIQVTFFKAEVSQVSAKVVNSYLSHAFRAGGSQSLSSVAIQSGIVGRKVVIKIISLLLNPSMRPSTFSDMHF